MGGYCPKIYKTRKLIVVVFPLSVSKPDATVAGMKSSLSEIVQKHCLSFDHKHRPTFHL